MKNDLGVIGVGVMGRNLAWNAAEKGYHVGVFDVSPEAVAACASNEAPSRRVEGHASLESLAASLKRPRSLLLMVKAGETVDQILERLAPHLEPGDVVMDGGNSHFADTQRRSEFWEARGLSYLGVGISGGEAGARRGPSMMVGGSEAGWQVVRPVLQAMAAKAGPDGSEPCCERVGAGGSGHYVKMVHNGIEYGDMQLIAEAYVLLRDLFGMPYEGMADLFARWNEGDLGSYLIGITADLLAMKDARTGKPIAEIIHDAAGQKGTGKWMSQEALDLGVPSTLVTEAVFARVLSSLTALREQGREVFAETQTPSPSVGLALEELEQALFTAKLCSYAQGFLQLKEASDLRSWNLNPAVVARLWREGCIIRSRILDAVARAFDTRPELACLIFASPFREQVRTGRSALRSAVAAGVAWGLPSPAMASALHFLDSLARPTLPTNLVQAQRDYFGAHGFRRVDEVGTFHLEPAPR